MVYHLIAAIVAMATTLAVPAGAEYPLPKLSPQIIREVKAAGLDAATTNATLGAIQFEQSNWANGAAGSDPFYTAPANSSGAAPGALLVVEEVVNTTLYTMPPNTALSRIAFQTRDLNGSAVPATAFVLWPYWPRETGDGWPVVAWAHGTSGVWRECAPSHIRNLWYQFAVPFTLALQGFVVVAPDYQGLGINETADGHPIAHSWAANPSLADDMFYAVQAAQAAFPDLSKRFVTMGHSQGGGAAWAAAQRQAIEPVPGHLGSIAGSPVTKTVQPGITADSPILGLVAADIFPGVQATFPDLKLSDIFTSEGIKHYKLYKLLSGCQSVASTLVTGSGLVRKDWASNHWVQAFQHLTSNGGKTIANPLLIIQGLGDPVVDPAGVEAAVNDTCSKFPQSQLEFLKLPNVTHVPAMWATQRYWIDWIQDRFDQKSVDCKCTSKTMASARSYEAYDKDYNWILRIGTPSYELS